MGAEPIPHEMLLRHAGFLRRLARDLVGDPTAADDAVQEVWLRALEKPPKHGANVRGWLRVVLTNLVRSKARGESRREARERERALDAGGELLATNPSDEATLRSVTEAVLALEEPLRTTVLQHYFQGITTAEIATRDNLPVSTVKSRLQRALEILRERMMRESGDTWRASLLALTVPAKFGKGVVLMSLKTKLAIAVVALVATALVYRRLTVDFGGPPDSDREVAMPSPAVERADLDPKPIAATEPPQPRARVPIAVPADVTDPRPDSLIYGSVLDPKGKPIQGARFESISITDENGKSRVADAKADGAFAFHAMPCGRYWMRATVDGFVPTERTIELQPNQLHVRQDLTLNRAPRLTILATTPDGEDLTEALNKAGNKRIYWDGALCPVATAERPGTWWTETDGNRSNPHGLGHFKDDDPVLRTDPTPTEKGLMGVLMLTREPPLFVSLLDYHRVLQTREVKRGDKEVHFILAAQDIVALTATLRMQIVDAETQKPIKGASVQLESGSGGRGTHPSNEEGVVVAKDLDPGQYDLRIQANGYEIGVKRALAEGGPESDIGQVALEPGVPFEARVVDASGGSLNANFSLGVLDGATHELAIEDRMSYGMRAGVLQIAGLGRRLYVLRTTNHNYATEEESSGTKWVSGNVVVDLRSGAAPSNYEIRLKPARRLVIQVRDDDAVGLRFQVLDEAGLNLVGYRLYASAPFGVSLPDGSYMVQLLDSSRKLLCEKPVTLSGSGATVELSR